MGIQRTGRHRHYTRVARRKSRLQLKDIILSVNQKGTYLKSYSTVRFFSISRRVK